MINFFIWYAIKKTGTKELYKTYKYNNRNRAKQVKILNRNKKNSKIPGIPYLLKIT